MGEGITFLADRCNDDENQGQMKATRTHNVEAARELRRRSTPAEAAAWRLLRDRRFGGVKFRRQHPVGPYVLDFCCAALRLAIELDGGIHERQIDADAHRQRELESHGYRLLRFTNDDVLHRPDFFAARVLEAVQSLAPSQSLDRLETM